MPGSYLQVKQPPWRYMASAAAFATIVLVLFGLYHNKDSAPRLAIVGAKGGEELGLVDHVFNATLGFEKILAVNLPERTDHRDGLILASAVSNIDIAFIDGVHGDKVLEKTLPPERNKGLKASSIGSWRAHLNAIADVVHNNYTSALIVEDDVDWDVRLKTLLKDFALSSQALTQSPTDVAFHNLPLLPLPRISPYGDDWDLLWLGHCGMALPTTGAKAVHYNDSSVPEPQYLHSYMMSDPTPLGEYPSHTRIVMREVSDPVCSLAYAVSQSGARKILYTLGLKTFDGPFDLMLRAWCEGLNGNESNGRQVCLGVLPQLFDHHRRKGPKNWDSDIEDHGAEYREKPETLNIRWSVRMNMERILRGATEYEDQWPDTG
ncbi:hypothetical protein MMC30_005562 [Trapelia coarctata]|nr:hypothetical protein [Trapelia coarctata]